MPCVRMLACGTGQRGELPRVDPACGRLHHEISQLLAMGVCKHLLPDGPVVPPGLQHVLPQGRCSLIHGDLCAQDSTRIHHIQVCTSSPLPSVQLTLTDYKWGWRAAAHLY